MDGHERWTRASLKDTLSLFPKWASAIPNGPPCLMMRKSKVLKALPQEVHAELPTPAASSHPKPAVHAAKHLRKPRCQNTQTNARATATKTWSSRPWAHDNIQLSNQSSVHTAKELGEKPLDVLILSLIPPNKVLLGKMKAEGLC